MAFTLAAIFIPQNVASPAFARGPTPDCKLPKFVAGTSKRHDHPAVLILYYRRNPDRDRSSHDIVRMVVPPKGLGIESRPLPKPLADAQPTYRSVHVHGSDGRLHVEPKTGRQFRLCELFALWKSSKEDAAAMRDVLESATTHIRIGKKYLRDVPVPMLLQMPLGHSETIMLFIEEKSPL